MTEETRPQTSPETRPAPLTAAPAQPDKPRRRKKAPPIDFDALDDRDHKLIRSIATTGARVAGKQQKLREAQLTAMKETLPDMLADAEAADPRLLRQWFAMMLASATPANAKKIATHPLCPADLAATARNPA